MNKIILTAQFCVNFKSPIRLLQLSWTFTITCLCVYCLGLLIFWCAVSLFLSYTWYRTRCVAGQTLFNSELWTHPCGPSLKPALFFLLRDENRFLRAVTDAQHTFQTLWHEYAGSFHVCRTGPGHPLAPGLRLGTPKRWVSWEELLLRLLPLKAKPHSPPLPEALPSHLPSSMVSGLEGKHGRNGKSLQVSKAARTRLG